MQYATVRLSEIEQISSRLDAEYYRPAFIESEHQLKRNKWDYLGNLAESIRSFGAYSLCNQIEYRENGIPFLRAKDIKEGFIDFSDVLYIDSEANELLWKSDVQPETVLFTMSGTVGNTAIAPRESDYPINSSQDVAKIRTSQRLNPFYLSVFLQSSYGKRQATRLPVGSVQQHVFLWQLENLIIPLFEDTFQTNLARCFKQVLRLQREAGNSYQEAQILLLSEIGLVDWQPRQQLTFVRSFSDTKRAGRIDAEHFQPKYDDIISAIRGYPGGWDRLGNLISMRKCVEVGSGEYQEDGVPFVRVSNLSPFEITEEKCISEDLYAEVQQHQPKQGEILFSKDGTPGIAHYLREQPSKMIPSGGILRLKGKTDKVNNEYLALVLNSILTQEQVNRDVGGSVILHWRPDQVGETAIPILPEEKQTLIQQRVTESFSLRKQSKHLLECAKRAVEIAIEEDEQTAIDWLKSETDTLQIKASDSKSPYRYETE